MAERDTSGFWTTRAPFTTGPIVYLGAARTELQNFEAIGPKGGPATAYCCVWTDARLYAAAQDLLAAAKKLEEAEAFHLDCSECEGLTLPEICGHCFPLYDDARVMRRNAIEKAEGKRITQDYPADKGEA